MLMINTNDQCYPDDQWYAYCMSVLYHTHNFISSLAIFLCTKAVIIKGRVVYIENVSD